MTVSDDKNKHDVFARILLGIITVFVGWGTANYSKMGDTIVTLSAGAAAQKVHLDGLAEDIRDLRQSQISLASDMRSEQAKLAREWKEDSSKMALRLQEILVELARLSPRQEVQRSEGK